MDQFKYWLLATRPKTLIASFMGVMVGGSIAHAFNDLICLVSLGGCLLFSLCIQIGTNFYNDYYDYIRGADNFRDIAPERFASSGRIEPIKIKNMATFVMIASFFLGVSVVFYAQASWLFYPFGIICIFCGYCYTGGIFPLAYNGLGDIFVVLFFGVGSVVGTFMLLSGTSAHSLWTVSSLGLAVGLVINNLLVVNNYRDFEQDKTVSKNTSVVLFGKKFGLFLYIVGIFLPPLICLSVDTSLWLTIFSLVPGVLGYRALIKAKVRSHFNLALRYSSASVLIFGVNLIAGLLLIT